MDSFLFRHDTKEDDVQGVVSSPSRRLPGSPKKLTELEVGLRYEAMASSFGVDLQRGRAFAAPLPAPSPPRRATTADLGADDWVHGERGDKVNQRLRRLCKQRGLAFEAQPAGGGGDAALALKVLDKLASSGFNQIEKWTSLPTDDLKSAPPMGYKGSGPSLVARDNRRAQEDAQQLKRGALTNFGRDSANASAAVGVAHANRRAEEAAQGLERGALHIIHDIHAARHAKEDEQGLERGALHGPTLARRAKEEAQGLKRGALQPRGGGAGKRGKKSPGGGRPLTQARIDAEKKAGKKFGFCKCGKEGPLGGQHNVGNPPKYCGKYKPA